MKNYKVIYCISNPYLEESLKFLIHLTLKNLIHT